MYKINNFNINYITVTCLNNECHYFYNIESKEIVTSNAMDKEFLEYALGAEEFVKKWLEHNKEWL